MLKLGSFSFLKKNVLMSKGTTIYGIDISKDKLDVYSEKGGHFVAENSPKGFEN